MSQPINVTTEPRTQIPAGRGSHFPRPTARQWALHASLFLLTVITTTICGIVMAAPDVGGNAGPETGGFAGSVWLIPWYFVMAVVELLRLAFVHPALLKQGRIFSGSLMAILASQEWGSYSFLLYYW